MYYLYHVNSRVGLTMIHDMNGPYEKSRELKDRFVRDVRSGTEGQLCNINIRKRIQLLYKKVLSLSCSPSLLQVFNNL